jgi:hypothetical protein
MYSEWLIVFKGQVNIYFSAILFWQKQVTFDEIRQCLLFDQHTDASSLKQQSTSRDVVSSDTLS